MTHELNNECWRNISGYLKYQVSNAGRVRNAKTGKILKQCLLSRGYLYVCLYEHRKQKNHSTDLY